VKVQEYDVEPTDGFVVGEENANEPDTGVESFEFIIEPVMLIVDELNCWPNAMDDADTEPETSGVAFVAVTDTEPV
jgi:hypothetical protein